MEISTLWFNTQLFCLRFGHPKISRYTENNLQFEDIFFVTRNFERASVVIDILSMKQ